MSPNSCTERKICSLLGPPIPSYPYCIYLFPPLIDIDVSGSSAYFSFRRSLIPISPPYSVLCRNLFLVSVFPLMIMSIDSPCAFHPDFFQKFLIVNLRGNIFSHWYKKYCVFLVYCSIWTVFVPLMCYVICDYSQVGNSPLLYVIQD